MWRYHWTHRRSAGLDLRSVVTTPSLIRYEVGKFIGNRVVWLVDFPSSRKFSVVSHHGYLLMTTPYPFSRIGFRMELRSAGPAARST
jgi:hypothetical protein